MNSCCWKPKSETKLSESEKFFTKFSQLIIQRPKSESKKFQTKLLKAKNIYISLNFCIQRLKVRKFSKSEND